MYLEEGMATLSSIFSWRIPWTKEHGRLQSMGSQRVGHNWVCTHPSLIHLLYSRNYHNIVKQLHSSTIFFFFWMGKEAGLLWSRTGKGKNVCYASTGNSHASERRQSWAFTPSQPQRSSPSLQGSRAFGSLPPRVRKPGLACWGTFGKYLIIQILAIFPG